jgi:hypothetical protein
MFWDCYVPSAFPAIEKHINVVANQLYTSRTYSTVNMLNSSI